MNETYGYIAGFNGDETIEIYATSLYAAKQQAMAHFKPSKKNAMLVWVVLAEKDGQPVTHVAVD